MPYLVDGNNVMAQTIGWHRDLPAARKRLIHDLVRLVAAFRVKVKVVFDGVPDQEFAEGRKFKSVHILYARPGSDADSRIKELLSRSTHNRDLVVVSSDKALVSFAAHKGARVMASHKFKALLQEAAARAEAEKPERGQELDVDEWLAFFNKGRF
jgi:predicted RNA-binding protein with PIN domain